MAGQLEHAEGQGNIYAGGSCGSGVGLVRVRSATCIAMNEFGPTSKGKPLKIPKRVGTDSILLATIHPESNS